MVAQIAAVALSSLGLMYMLLGQLFPVPSRPVAEHRSLRQQPLGTATSRDGSGCAADALSAKEADHEAGVALRRQLVQKWAPQGSADGWDAAAPMDSAQAWNSPTVWDVYAPTYGCNRPLHVGGVGSSAWDKSFPLESKAVCNPEQLQRVERCVIYSFGVGWDTTFEISMLRFAPHCKVRVFDPTTSAEKFWQLVKAQTPDGEVPPAPPALDFVQVGLAAESSENYREGMLWNNKESINVMTLGDIMKKQGDEHLTILKVDIEGSEWTALPQSVESGAMAKVDQLLLEVHMAGCEAGYRQHGRGKLARLLDTLEGAGMRAFSNIPNLVPVSKGNFPGCAEYSFVNKNGPFVTRSCGA